MIGPKTKWITFTLFSVAWLAAVVACGNQAPAVDPACMQEGRCNRACLAPDPDCSRWIA